MSAVSAPFPLSLLWCVYPDCVSMCFAASVMSSMLYYTFPALIHKFDNGDGGNCAIFDKWHQHQDFKVPHQLLSTLLAIFAEQLCLHV